MTEPNKPDIYKRMKEDKVIGTFLKDHPDFDIDDCIMREIRYYVRGYFPKGWMHKLSNMDKTLPYEELYKEWEKEEEEKKNE